MESAKLELPARTEKDTAARCGRILLAGTAQLHLSIHYWQTEASIALRPATNSVTTTLPLVVATHSTTACEYRRAQANVMQGSGEQDHYIGNLAYINKC